MVGVAGIGLEPHPLQRRFSAVSERRARLLTFNAPAENYGKSLFNRKSLFALPVAGLAMTAISLAAGPAAAAAAAAAAAEPVGFYPISMGGSSHRLDNAAQQSSKVQMWNCTGVQEQNWLALGEATGVTFTLVNQHTGLCVSAPYDGAGPITMTYCTPDVAAGQWVFGNGNGKYVTLYNLAHGLGLTTDSVGNGTVPRVTACDLSDHYDWWDLHL
jgi:hypothetical protein